MVNLQLKDKLIYKWLSEPLDGKQKYVIAVLSTLVFFFSAHAYGCLSNIYAHDSFSEMNLFGLVDYAGIPNYLLKIQAGRFTEVLYQSLIRGKLALPWLTGILSFTWIALFSLFVVRIFELSDRWTIILTTGLFATNLTTVATMATYFHDADTNFLGLALAGASACEWRYGNRGHLKGILLIALCLGCYQSYFCVAVALIMIVSILDLCDEVHCNKVLYNGVKALIMLLLGGLLYLGVVFLTIKIFHTELGGTFEASISTRQPFLKSIIQVYIGTLIPIVRTKSLVTADIQSVISLAVLISEVMFLTVLLKRKAISRKSKLLIILLAAMLPIGMNLTALFSTGVTILSGYAWWLFYFLAVLLAKRVYRAEIDTKILIIKAIPSILLLFLLLENIQTANAAYVLREFRNTANITYISRIAGRMEQMEDYEAGITPVCFTDVPSYTPPTGFERVNEIMGLRFSQVSTYERYRSFFRVYLGADLNLVEVEEREKLKRKAEEREMKPFPNSNSMQFIDGVLVIFVD